MQPTFNLNINSAIYLKDPESSSLGKRILSGGIDLIAEIGFESFNFKKLATNINSTEASIYRYFDCKHKLLLYLVNWYWTWLLFRMYYEIANIDSPEEKLSRIIRLLTQKVMQDANYEHINEEKLYQIIINEGAKSYLTHQVDEDNLEGDFTAYKNLVNEIASVVLECNPNYEFNKMIISTMIEGIHNQRFFAKHLPKLTESSDEDSIYRFFSDMVFKTIKC